MIIGFAAMFYYFLSASNFNFAPVINFKSSLSGSAYWLTVFAFLNSNTAYWATMAVTMPDYTRFAKTQFSQTIGQIPMSIMMIAGTLDLLAADTAMITRWLRIIWRFGRVYRAAPLKRLVATTVPSQRLRRT
jgi:NCS1 family nucleobase:cation symporter-1